MENVSLPYFIIKGSLYVDIVQYYTYNSRLW